MATGDRTVRLSWTIVGERFLQNRAEITRAGLMAVLAPARAVAHRTVVIHFFAGPVGKSTGMAGLATQARAVEYR